MNIPESILPLLLGIAFAGASVSGQTTDSPEITDFHADQLINICGKPRIKLFYKDKDRPVSIFIISGKSKCRGNGYCGAGAEEGLLYVSRDSQNGRDKNHIEFQFLVSCWKSIENSVVQTDSSIEIWNGRKKLFHFDKKTPLGFQTPME